MAARNAARRQPAAAQRAVLFERFNSVRGATWIIAAGRGEQRAQGDLVPANEKNEHGTHFSRRPVSNVGRRRRHCVVGACRAVADRSDVGAQCVELGRVRLAACTNRNIGCLTRAQRRQQLDARELSQATFESVAIHCGMLVTRHDDPNARNAERGSEEPDIEIRGPDSFPLSNDSLYVEAPRQPMLSRKAEAVVTRLRTCLAA
jgi:hypothetical protein